MGGKLAGPVSGDNGSGRRSDLPDPPPGPVPIPPSPAALRPALIVAGPTCSGKSALALDLARGFTGTVINADAMQTYRDLRILTARPTPADEAAVPHVLYGIRPAEAPATAAWWRDAALDALAAAAADGRLPILCGGTGLYLRTLTGGIADIPEPDPAARAEARALIAAIGAQALHARLAAVDPVTAARLAPGDSQRIARAWEVWRSTGVALSAWQARGPAPAAPGWRFALILLDPPRADLRAAIAARTEAMLAAGALEEVRALLARTSDPALPLRRAHGVPELAAHLRGDVTLAEAASRITLVTAQYTKRQATWFRHQTLTGHVHTIHARYAGLAQLSKSLEAFVAHFIQSAG